LKNTPHFSSNPLFVGSLIAIGVLLNLKPLGSAMQQLGLSVHSIFSPTYDVHGRVEFIGASDTGNNNRCEVVSMEMKDSSGKTYAAGLSFVSQGAEKTGFAELGWVCLYSYQISKVIPSNEYTLLLKTKDEILLGRLSQDTLKKLADEKYVYTLTLSSSI
jgi:hypothetical protein